MKGVIMKKLINISIIVALVLFTVNAYAGYYDYSFKNIPGNQAQSTVSHSNTDFLLQMTLWINDTHTITAQIARKDGNYLEDGNIYLQANTEKSIPLNRIDCGDNSTSIKDYSTTLTSLQSLDDIPINWAEDFLLIYARYETENQYAWTGPIIIKREVSSVYGSLQVGILTTSAINDGAAWSIETPGSDTGWSSWYESGVEITGLNVGATTIRFKPVTGYVTPNNKIVEVKSGPVTTTEAVYIPLEQSILGITLPRQATEAGAGWRAKFNGLDSVFYPGNEAQKGFDLGPNTVSFKPIEGWYTPDPQTIVVKADEPTVVTGIYCKIRPYAPDGVDASNGLFVGKVKFRWNAVSCVDRYEIYRSTVSEPTPDDRIAVNFPGTLFIDTTGEPGREYYYWVRAVNERGVGDFSKPVIGYSKLDSPKNVRATDGVHTGKVRIEWDPVPGALYYIVYRNTDTSFMSVGEPIAVEVEATLFDDLDATPEKKFYYWVKAENSIMTSDFSEYDQGYARMGIPEFLVASDSEFFDRVEICNSPVKGAIAYQVDIALDTRTRTRNKTVRVKTTECFQHTAADPFKKYLYRVRAYNQYGFGDWTDYDAGTRAMKAPVIHASKRTYSDKITISWLSVDGATKYYIYKNETNDFDSAVQVGKSILNFYDYPTSETREFYFWVQAVNANCMPVSQSDVGYISDGCEFNVSPADIVVDAETGIGQINVVVESQNLCTWHAETSVDWIQILSGESGNNNGVVEFQAAENRSLDSRTAIITVAGQGILVEQEGMNPTSLSVNATNGGKLLINGEALELPLIKEVAIGDVVTFEAIPDENWQFAYFSGSVVDTTNPLTIEIAGNTSIIANYTQTKYCMNVSVVGQGDVFIDGKESMQECFPQGSVVNLMATNKEASVYVFTNWSGDVEKKDSNIQVVMDSDKEITAMFSGWAADIHAQGLNLNGYYQSLVTIGVGFEAFFRDAPPAPPRYSSLMRLKYNNKDGVTLIQQDNQDVYQFVLSIDPHGNMGPPQQAQSTVVKWDPETFASSGTYQLIEGNDIENATIVIENMRETTEYTVTGLSSNQIYSIIWIPPVIVPPGDQPVQLNSIMMSLLCESENFGGAYRSIATIGLDRFAKATSSPPAPPVSSTGMSIITRDGKYLTVHMQEEGKTQYEWFIVVTPAGDALPIGSENTVNLSWELSEESYTGTFQLIKQKIEDGEFVDDEISVEDMSKTKNISITGDDRKQYFKIVCQLNVNPVDPEEPDCEFQLDLEAGWNLISLPLIPENNIAKYIIPGVQTIYQYIDGGYKEISNTDPLESGIGYWVLVSSDTTVNIQGQCFNHYSKELKQGWYLLGCIESSASPGTNVANSIEVMYQYIDGSYEIVTECKPGYGFWINMLEDATLTFQKAHQE
jgi:hypothetical protein